MANGRDDETPKRAAILIFDTDEDWAQRAALLLREGGLNVDIETGDFQNCFAHATKRGYAAAVVNAHALDDPKERLVEFARQFPAIATIIVEERDDSSISELLWPPSPLVRYVFGVKDYRVLTDLPRLVDAHLDICRVFTGDLEIEFPTDIDDLLNEYSQSHTGPMRMRKGVSLDVLKGEFRYVITSMFSEPGTGTLMTKRVTVEAFSGEGGRSSASVFCLTPDVLSEVKGSKSAVLKFGPKDEIKQESFNYDRYVEWYLTVDQTVRKIGYAEANYFAGIMYSYPRDVAGGYQSFADFIRASTTEKCVEIIQKMFDPSNQHWLSKDTHNLMRSAERHLQTYYVNKVLHASLQEMKEVHYRKLSKEISNLEKKRRTSIWTEGENELTFNELNIRIPNPISFLSRSSVDTLKLTLIHGDLHGQNILVDNEQRYFFIDFFYTGPGHIYRDFIELELSVRYDLFSSRSLPSSVRLTGADSSEVNMEGLKELVKLEKALIASISSDRRDAVAALSDQGKKAFAIIRAIRHYAFANWAEHPKHYYEGLIFSSLKALKYFYPLDLKLYRLILSGLYVEALQQGKIR